MQIARKSDSENRGDEEQGRAASAQLCRHKRNLSLKPSGRWLVLTLHPSSSGLTWSQERLSAVRCKHDVPDLHCITDKWSLMNT